MTINTDGLVDIVCGVSTVSDMSGTINAQNEVAQQVVNKIGDDDEIIKAEAIHLAGLPQTAGAPDGYGDLASAVNATLSVGSIKELTTDTRAPQSCDYFFTDSSGAQSQWVYIPDISKANHNGVDILSPESIAAWDGTAAGVSTLLNWSGAGVGVFVKISRHGVDTSGATAQESGAVSSLIALQNMIDEASPVDISGVGRKRYVIDGAMTYKSETALIGRDYAFNGTVIKPSGNVSALLPLVDGNAYTRFKCTNVMLECDNHTSVFAVDLKNAFLFEFNNVWIRNGFKGFSIVGCDSITFNNVKLMETQKSEAVFVGDGSRSIRFNDCNFETSGTYPLVGGNVTINGTAQTATQAEFNSCQWERSKFEVVSGRADILGGKFSDGAIRLLGGSQDCQVSATCYGTTTYHDVGFNNEAKDIRSFNFNVDSAKWPRIVDSSATSLAAPVVGAINDESVMLVSVLNASTAAATGGTVSLKDGATVLATYTGIDLPASLGSSGLATRQVKSFLLTGKATTANPIVELSANLYFASIAGGKNLVANGLFLADAASWLTVSATTAWASGKMNVTPTGSNWAVYQALQSICKNGKKYMAIAKYSGVASLTYGDAWNGSPAKRPLSDTGIDGYWADGDKLAMVGFTYYRNLGNNLSLGRVGSNTAASVDFIVLIEI